MVWAFGLPRQVRAQIRRDPRSLLIGNRCELKRLADDRCRPCGGTRRVGGEASPHGDAELFVRRVAWGVFVLKRALRTQHRDL